MQNVGQNDVPIQFSPAQHATLLTYVQRVYEFLGGSNFNLRANLEQRDRTYYRENDLTRDQQLARLYNMYGDAKKMQNITVPVVQPQVESTVGYLTEVFCTGSPFFGVVTSPADADAGVQMETTIDDNSRRFNWRSEAIKVFRDGLKYNVMAAEVDWKKKKVFSIINDPTKRTEVAGASATEWYAGNFFKRMDIYNTILDTRVPPNQMHISGEFGGYVELLPRTALKQLIIDLGEGTMNVRQAFESNCANYTVGANSPGEYYIPLINPYALIQQTSMTTNWLSWFAGVTKNGEIQYRDLYEVAYLYCRFLPSDFGLKLPAANTPQIFKLVVVNKRWIIFMRRQSNAHNFLPIVVAQPFDDGLGYQAKSFADNVTPYQELSSALWNAGLESKRRLVFDRLFYDPSRINKVDIDRASAVARIPVKPSGYGKPVGDAVFSSNYRDDNAVGVMQMAQSIQQMAQLGNGLNNAQQGQFQKGNRTRYEFETVMNKSDWHPRLLAITIEDTFFGPVKEITKMNILQYQAPATLYSIPQQQPVQVDPIALRKATYTFKLTDGQTPSEQQVSFDLLDKMVQLGMTVPAINAEYDIMGMLAWSIKLRGGYWINDFKRNPQQQQQYLQTVNATSNAEAPPNAQAQAAATQQQMQQPQPSTQPTAKS